MYTKEQKERVPPTRKELYMGGKTKTADYAVFYNIAFNGILSKIHFKETGQTEFDEAKLSVMYGQKYLDVFETARPSNIKHDFKDETYLTLRDFLWKGYETDKNSSGHALTDEDKSITRALLVKLRVIRNYHSHIWHNNDGLKFDNSLQIFIKKKHDDAINSLYATHPAEVDAYKEESKQAHLFKDNYITTEGRVFFLSFFLTSGEMSSFLQQHRGSKRTDELKFRIKHIVYRYYTHRDGSTRQKFSQEDDVLSSFSPNDQQDVLMARQSFKLITYLNDVPDSANNIDLYPLFTDSGERKPAETAQELKAFCDQRELFTTIQITDVANKKGEIQTGVLNFSIPALGDTAVRLGRGTFHKLIIDTLRRHDNGKFVYDGLTWLITERLKLIEELQKLDTLQHLDETSGMAQRKFFEEYMLHKLNGNLYLQQLMRDWFYAFEKDLKKEGKLRDKLVQGCIQDPVAPGYYDFYFEEGEKPRNTDRFSEFAVKYLIDFNLAPDWEWMMESFGVADKHGKAISGKNKAFFSHFKSGTAWRLSVTDGCVIVRLKRLPDFRFQLGHRALKNLLIAHFYQKANIGTLLNKLTKDTQKIRNVLYNKTSHTLTDLALLERKNLPRFVLLTLGDAQTAAGETVENATVATLKRISNLIAKLRDWRTNHKTISRNEKNRIIMDCYQLFDWKYPDTGTYKFLRRDEYQNMSIYHYMLERVLNLREDITYFQQKIQDAEDYGKKKKYQMAIFDNNKQIERTETILSKLLKDVKNRIPEEVNQILENSESLDDLLKNATTDAIIKLSEWQLELEKGNNELFEAVRQKLGIPQPVPVVNEAVKLRWTDKQNGHFFHQVHPDVVVHHFFKAELSNPANSNSNQGFSLSKLIRGDESYTAGLKNTHYNYKPYLATLNTGNATEKAVLHKAIRFNNTQLTEDALLWKVAQVYLGKVNPVVKSVLDAQLNKSGILKIENLHATELPLQVNIGNDTLTLSLRFHQLDDILLFASKAALQKAAAHYLNRISPEERAALLTEPNTLPYNEMKQEMMRINHQSLEFAHYILDYERGIIDAADEKTLPAEEEPFPAVCKRAQLSDEQSAELILLRNHAFHNKIPMGWNYTQKRQTEWLRKLLNITEKEPVDYEALAREQKKNI